MIFFILLLHAVGYQYQYFFQCFSLEHQEYVYIVSRYFNLLDIYFQSMATFLRDTWLRKINLGKVFTVFDVIVLIYMALLFSFSNL